MKTWINLGLWEAGHLPLPTEHWVAGHLPLPTEHTKLKNELASF